eukprot:CAMPEP_0176470502 /NCGR_PEP_ID=MMETSP0127-20121128/40492_1 /TAXON_ID=938130 /ORGANISM="Platyophrya macrostoma, Strain WH" /LENGTH=208 /DNA_ID=CAMNT_0017864805 /DNA_START=23 /DNA_END=645 /DNA_ORIENTATION=-
MITKPQKDESQDPYGSNIFCDRLVLPFVLARYKNIKPYQTEDFVVSEPNEIRSLQDLDDPSLSRLQENTNAKPVAQSLTTLPSDDQNKGESIIEIVRRRLSIKDEAKKQMALAQNGKKQRELIPNSPKLGASTYVKSGTFTSPYPKVPNTQQTKASVNNLMKSPTKVPQTLTNKTFKTVAASNINVRRNLGAHLRASSLPMNNSEKPA